MVSEGAEDGLVVIADYQHSGRGRFSRTWWSQPGQNLLLTVVLRRTVRFSSTHSTSGRTGCPTSGSKRAFYGR